MATLRYRTPFNVFSRQDIEYRGMVSRLTDLKRKANLTQEEKDEMVRLQAAISERKTNPFLPYPEPVTGKEITEQSRVIAEAPPPTKELETVRADLERMKRDRELIAEMKEMLAQDRPPARGPLSGRPVPFQGNDPKSLAYQQLIRGMQTELAREHRISPPRNVRDLLQIYEPILQKKISDALLKQRELGRERSQEGLKLYEKARMESVEPLLSVKEEAERRRRFLLTGRTEDETLRPTAITRTRFLGA